MAFKPGQGNAYNVLKTQLKQAEQQLADERAKPMLREVANEIGEAMMIILAITPYEEWPQLAKTAYNHIRGNMPTAAQLYKDRLPKSSGRQT